jgi:hypothetical protein
MNVHDVRTTERGFAILKEAEHGRVNSCVSVVRRYYPGLDCHGLASFLSDRGACKDPIVWTVPRIHWKHSVLKRNASVSFIRGTSNTENSRGSKRDCAHRIAALHAPITAAIPK